VIFGTLPCYVAGVGWEAWATLVVLGGCLVALVRGMRPDAALLGGAAVVGVLGLFTDRLPKPKDLAAGFGNEALVTLGVLFVVAEGLSQTGGMSLVTERLLGRPRSAVGAQMRLALPVTVTSAFLNNTTVVAMFMPVVGDWAKRSGIAPSKLFIPLSYFAVLGGLCTLIGTSTNLIVQALLVDARLPTMGMFTIGAVGVPAAIAGIAYLLLVGRRLLPERSPPSASLENAREYTVEMLVDAGGAVDGKTVEDAGLRHLPRAFLVSVERDGEVIAAVSSRQLLRGGDRLLFVGVVDAVVDLQKIRGLRPATDQVYKLTDRERGNRVLVEAVVGSACPLVGQTIREGRFRTRYDAAVIAVHRGGERITRKIGDIELRAGDTLLLETTPDFVERHRHSRELFLASVPGSQPLRHERAWIALLILAAMVAVNALEPWTHVPLLVAASVAAVAMITTRCLSLEQARRAVDWNVLLAVAGAIALGRAMDASGAARAISEGLLGVFSGLGPRGALLGIYVMTLLLTEQITNNAAAVIAFPVARAAAAQLGVDFMPFAVALAIAASAGFALPTGYQTHLMVYGPGGYRLGDFVRAGVPLDLLVMIVTVWLTPLFFPF
jgi:di/tricarboxylate transporter